MGMTTDNLCNSCTNIGCEFQSGIVRAKCAFYMPPHIEPDNCGNYAVMQPTAEAIPKDQYEARLKADMVAMLEELQLEIEQIELLANYTRGDIKRIGLDIIQTKLDKLRGEQNEKQFNTDYKNL